MKKIFLSLMIVLFALSGLITVSAETYDIYTYEVSGGKVTITDCQEDVSGKIEIPSIINNYPVTAIGDNAFCECFLLTNVAIPDSVTEIGELAFCGCSQLMEITIPDSVTSIGASAFEACDSLIGILIPDSVEEIGNWAFGGCFSLATVTLPNNITSISDSLFTNCPSLTDITIPDSVTSIGEYAFAGCDSLTKIALPTKLTSIGNGAFENCSELTEIKIPDNVTHIGEWAFANCSSLADITLSKNITEISMSAFEACSELTEIIIPDNVTSIGEYAFGACTSLTNITIPKNVSSIHPMALCDCFALENIAVAPNNQYFSSNNGVLFNKEKNVLVKYPDGKQTSVYTVPDSVADIADKAFANCPSISEVLLSKNLKTIGIDSFACSSLTKITLPNGFASIADSAFSGCRSLTTVTIPISLTAIGDFAFAHCERLAYMNYEGSEEDWADINVGYMNDNLTTGRVTYNYTNASAKISSVASSNNSLKLISKSEIFGSPEIESFGTTFIPLWLFNENSKNVATVEYDNANYNIQSGQTYSATLNGIPESCHDMYIVGKSFVKTADGTYTWSSAKYASVNETELKSLE